MAKISNQDVKKSVQNNNNQNQQNLIIGNNKNMYNLLESYKNQIERALPKHVTPERMMRVAMTAVSKTPKLLQCKQETVIGAIISASQLGLETDGALGHAYLLPYSNNCQLIVGYKGMIELAQRSGKIISIQANIVYENDYFDVEYGDGEKFTHKPYFMNGHEEPGEERFVYAYARLKDGGFQFIVLTDKDIQKAKNASQSANSQHSPWVKWPEEMKKKTAIKRLCKLLPMSVELAKAVELDNKVESGEGQKFDLSGDQNDLDLPLIPEINPEEAQVTDVVNWDDIDAVIAHCKTLKYTEIQPFIEANGEKFLKLPVEAQKEISEMQKGS